MASMENTRMMKPRTTSRSTILAHPALSFAAILLVMIFFFSTFTFSFRGYDHQLPGRVCDEIYVVAEGETLHTISDKCGDPFIIEQNPHIHDPDDVFPGLIIKITPATTSSSKSRYEVIVSGSSHALTAFSKLQENSRTTVAIFADSI